MSSKDVNGFLNKLNPDQTAPMGLQYLHMLFISKLGIIQDSLFLKYEEKKK